jgi:hypothetical protein
MTRLAPTWALTAAALDGTDDRHLMPGAHLRVLPSKLLGLPVAPLLVEKHVRDLPGEPSDDVLWKDKRQEVLTPAFGLASTGEVTAWLPVDPGNPVIFAEVLVKGDDKGVRVDAVVSGSYGDAVVASAAFPPYQVCATGMERLVVSGDGEVLGVRLLRLGELKIGPPREAWRLLALPIEDAARYRGIQNAEGEAKDRCYRGAPQRLGLHDEPASPDPASCSALDPGDEFSRVLTVYDARVVKLLDVVLNDTSAVPPALMMPAEPMTGVASSAQTVNASMSAPALAGVLQSALDPSMARWLGLLEHDDDPGQPGYLTVYSVRGAWVDYPQPDWSLFFGSLLGGPDDPQSFPLPLPDLAAQSREGGFLDLWTVAAVVPGQPAAPVSSPACGAGIDLGWQQEAPPSQTRHVTLPLAGLVPAAQVALGRETPTLVGLNPRLPEVLGAGPDRAIGIVPAVLAGAAGAPTATGQGEVHDRTAPADAATYRVAQSDWFGRWSQWAPGNVGAGVRPPLPTPLIEASYADPVTPGDDGKVTARCVQPRPGDLAAGGLPLDRLELEFEVQPGTWVPATVPAQAAQADGSPPTLVGSAAVPGLGLAERRRIQVRGRWVDTGSAFSGYGVTAVYAVDPRAPQPLVLPDTLEYATRPDALGRCRVDLAWAATAGTAYRVFMSDETTLRRRLDVLRGQGDAAAQQCVDALSVAHDAPARATLFRNHAGLFDRSCFELLTPSVLIASASGPMSYVHEVSGSLRVLVFYKVLPVSVLHLGPPLELGGETSFAGSALLIRGVPNSAPPPVPGLVVRRHPDQAGRAQLTVDVPAGQTAPVAVRVRRSRVQSADPLAMPVVKTVTPTKWPAVIDDAGPTGWDPAARLDPWWTFTWVVEVQGAPEPGSSVPGLWSQPSPPAALRLLPPEPAGVTPIAVTPGVGVVDVSFSHADPLDGQPVGEYRLALYRILPGTPPMASPVEPEVEASTARRADGTYTLHDPSTPPAGTRYVVEVVDPLGRRGPSVVVGTV